MTRQYDKKAFENNTYRDEIFARGYVLSAQSLVAPDHWTQGKLGAYGYAHDPRTPCYRAERAGKELLCLGIIHDVRAPEQSSAEFCDSLLDALCRSEGSFFDALSFSCGRYVIVWRDAKNFHAVTDATGMKSVYYCVTGDEKVIASHVRLVAWNMMNPQAAPGIRIKFGHPGIATLVEDVFLLTPNTCLDLSDMKPRRFWPKHAIQPLELDEAVELAGKYLQGAFDHYQIFYKPVISVTAGLDSRLTLSLMRNHPNASLMTYYRNDAVDTDEVDLEFAKKFQEISQRPVDILYLRQSKAAPKDFEKIQSHNTTYDHIKRLAWVYYKKFREDDKVIHVRSNISEVGREFWRGKKFPVKTGKDLARIYLYGDKEYKANYTFRVIEYFEEFDRVTGLTQCAGLIDLKSLFYWEFRMAAWHSGAVLESDPAFDTVSVYNCRRTLEILLSVDLKHRLKSAIIRKIIAQKWPRLSEYNVNGNPFWP